MKFLLAVSLHWLLIVTSMQSSASPALSTPFRMSLFSVPRTLDPAALTGSDSSHIFHNLFRGLYIYRIGIGLVPIGAKKCAWNPFPKNLECELNKKHKWSDGSVVVSEDYVRAYRRLVDPLNASREADQLSALQNYEAIIKGKAPVESLGVQAESATKLVFKFAGTDVDFLYRLASPSLVPYRRVSVLDSPETWLFNGPFKLSEWKQDQYIRLEPNSYYGENGSSKVSVEIRIVDDGTAALNLYDSKLLDFVPHVPTAQIPTWKKNPGYFETTIPRFDYIGFGPALTSLPELRKALTLASDFRGFQKLFQSRSRPGCPGFPKEWTGASVCIQDDVKKAKQAFEIMKGKVPKPLTYYFTQIPTDDLRRGAEFYQQAWKQNLGVEIDLQSREIGVYRALLRENPPPIFRRGVALDRPTCLAAVEMFESSSLENEIRFQNKNYDLIVQEMRKNQNKGQAKILCRRALEILYSQFAIVPQGEYALGRVMNPAFKGLQFTFHGAADLTHIQAVSK